MSVMPLLAIIMASISFSMGGLHLLFYFRQKTRQTDLSFGCLAVLVGAYAGLCAGLYSSETVAEGSLWLQWQLVVLNVIAIAFLWFIRDYTGLIDKKLLKAAGIVFTALALAAAINPANLVVGSEPSVKTLRLWWNSAITYYETQLGPVGFLQLAFMQINYLVIFGVSLLYVRKAGVGKGGRLAVATGLFVLSELIDSAVVLGLFEFVYTIEYAFLWLVVLMAYSLSSELRESVKAKEELQKVKERYDLAVRGSTDGLWDWPDVNSDHIWLSPRFYELLGYQDQEFTGSYSWFKNALHPKDRAKVMEANYRHLSERTPYDIEYRLLTKGGDYKWFRARGQALWDANDKPRRMSGSIQDITERKVTQEELERSERTLKTILDSAPLGIGVAMAREMKLVNRKLVELTGYSSEELTNSNSRMMYDSDEEFLRVGDEIYGKAATTGAGSVESQWRRKDGSVFDVWLIVSTIQDHDTSKGVIFMVTDITERKNIEREKERLVKALEDKNQQLESIIHVSSHDLRSPLVNIQGFSSELARSCEQVVNLLEEAEDVPCGLKEKLVPILVQDIPMSMKFISSSATKMDALMKSLLKLSRLGRQELDIGRMDTNQLIKDILDAMRFQIQECNAIVEISNLPECSADATALNQVFSNLVDNAIKYRDESRQLTIRVTAYEEDDTNVYVVEDNGVGIPQQHFKKIFEIFHRLQPDGQTSGEGMGLTIVRRILERHGGEIWVESEWGKGSRFFVRLPKANE